MSENSEQGFATKAIHAGQDPEQWTHGSVALPIVMSAAFQQDSPTQHRGYVYGRSGNPTRDCFETCLAAIENAKYGITFSSGLGATTAIIALLKAGDHIISGDNLYGGTNSLFQRYASKQNIQTTFVETEDSNKFIDAVKPNTKLIWLETPTNPMLKIADIKSIADKVKAIRSDIYIVVDNTFETSYFQRPLELGADISMYSLTKYINGHSDIIMGAAVTKKDDIAEKLKSIQRVMGIIPSPNDCAQVNRGIKTLELRMQQHMKNGLAVAKFLETHPYVLKVIHPYLPSHPQYKVAIKQMTGHSGMVSFYIKGNANKFLTSLKIFYLSNSLGGVQSLAALPSTMSHSSISNEEKSKLGITDNLIRLSVGIETEKDLLMDLDQALKQSVL